MRSVYAKILLWCLGTLILSLVAFAYISRYVAFRALGRTGPMGGGLAMQVEDAREAYEHGGVPQLSQYLDRLHRFLRAEHHLTDSKGRDLVTGEDRSQLLAEVPAQPGPPHRIGNNQMAIAKASENGKYRFIVIFPNAIDISNFLPYYLLILAAIALLCWLFAVKLASPLKEVVLKVRRFGHGELGVRVKSKRRDEIGDVARAFDEMAERIETLLTAERRLLQDVSHELRSPLARLSFAAELARTAPDRDAAVERMKKEIQRLTDLVGALLQVTRVEGDPRTEKLEAMDLDELLEELIADCALEADARGCHLVLRNPKPAELRGDRELLRRAIENVFRNAIRYAPAGSEIDVSLETKGTTAEVSIRDYGPGVPPEALPRIFKPFFRVDNSRDSATGGVGLGLAIAQRAVTVHHGHVWAENANPGLRVRVELPMG